MSTDQLNSTNKAVEFIEKCCPSIGSFYGPIGDVDDLLSRTAADMDAAPPTVLFQNRYKEHVAYALTMIAENRFTSPAAAIASVYLATRFEFYFRLLSGKLSNDGRWLHDKGKNEARAAISDDRLKRERIKSVALAYKIMKLHKSSAIARICGQLDSLLYAKPVALARQIQIADIGDRILYERNSAGHGELGDISSEGIFYGLLTTIIFYNQT